VGAPELTETTIRYLFAGAVMTDCLQTVADGCAPSFGD
jgi:hypothetical protein